MTIIYTPTHTHAAEELREACAALYDALDHEPAPGPLWDDWNNNAYQPAWNRHIVAEATYAHMFPAGHAPHTLDIISSANHHHTNPLRPSLAPSVYRTRDNRFLAGPYLPDRQKAGKWVVEYWPEGIDIDATPPLPVDANNLEHAQQIVDLITWAISDDGARNGEN